MKFQFEIADRKLKIVGASIAVVLAMAWICFLSAVAYRYLFPDPLNVTNFEQIKYGMTPPDVRKILGSPTLITPKPVIDLETWEWKHKDKVVVLIFIRGAVSFKESKGIYPKDQIFETK